MENGLKNGLKCDVFCSSPTFFVEVKGPLPWRRASVFCWPCLPSPQRRISLPWRTREACLCYVLPSPRRRMYSPRLTSSPQRKLAFALANYFASTKQCLRAQLLLSLLSALSLLAFSFNICKTLTNVGLV